MEQVIRLESPNRPTARQASRREKVTTDPEIIEQWGKTHGGTASDIRRQCPELKAKTVREISGMCERLVAEGRLQATNVPVPDSRYVGRSLEKSSQYMQPASMSNAIVG